MTTEARYRSLLAALSAFVLDHSNSLVEKFKPSMRDWGSRYQAVEAAQLPIAKCVDTALGDANAAGRALLQPFAEHNHCLHWEQSYRKQDELAPKAMLDAYGFAEIIGLRGPFVSDRLRAGIAAWGPGVDYPRHRHRAEEAYILLCGSAEFQLGHAAPRNHRGGDVVYVESNRPHALRSSSEGLVLCYLWQAGDLRQTSNFVT